MHEGRGVKGKGRRKEGGGVETLCECRGVKGKGRRKEGGGGRCRDLVRVQVRDGVHQLPQECWRLRQARHAPRRILLQRLQCSTMALRHLHFSGVHGSTARDVPGDCHVAAGFAWEGRIR